LVLYEAYELKWLWWEETGRGMGFEALIGVLGFVRAVHVVQHEAATLAWI